MARIIIPSSYEAERVILKVEYKRIKSKMNATVETVALTATIGSAKVTGFTKLGITP